MYDNRTDSNLQEIGDRVFVQDTTNWQAQPHAGAGKTNLVNNFRVGRVDARADQKGIPCPQSDVDSLQLTGVFTDIPDDQRECPSASAFEGFMTGVGGAINAYSASNQPMWDISNTTTWIRGKHHVQLRAELSALVAAARSRQRDSWASRTTSTSASPAIAVADFLLGYYTQRRPVPAGRVQRSRARQATRVSSISRTSHRTCRTTGRSPPG